MECPEVLLLVMLGGVMSAMFPEYAVGVTLSAEKWTPEIGLGEMLGTGMEGMSSGSRPEGSGGT
jgi:hypothetical protein